MRPLLLLGAQLRNLRESDQGPVLAHWATLNPPRTQSQRLQRSPWDPGRGEEVAAMATDDRLEPDQLAAAAEQEEGLKRRRASRNRETLVAPAQLHLAELAHLRLAEL